MINYSERAFIFDMDGTLVDNMRFHGAAWQAMLLENGIEADANDFGELKPRELIEKYLPFSKTVE